MNLTGSAASVAQRDCSGGTMGESVCPKCYRPLREAHRELGYGWRRGRSAKIPGRADDHQAKCQRRQKADPGWDLDKENGGKAYLEQAAVKQPRAKAVCHRALAFSHRDCGRDAEETTDSEDVKRDFSIELRHDC